MKTSQHTINQLGLQTVKTLVLLMVFLGVTFLLSNTATSSVEQSLAKYEENAEILKMLRE